MSAQARLHFIVFLWGFTAILGKLIALDANHLVWWRMGLTSVLLISSVCLFQKGKHLCAKRFGSETYRGGVAYGNSLALFLSFY